MILYKIKKKYILTDCYDSVIKSFNFLILILLFTTGNLFSSNSKSSNGISEGLQEKKNNEITIVIIIIHRDSVNEKDIVIYNTNQLYIARYTYT